MPLFSKKKTDCVCLEQNASINSYTRSMLLSECVSSVLDELALSVDSTVVAYIVDLIQSGESAVHEQSAFAEAVGPFLGSGTEETDLICTTLWHRIHQDTDAFDQEKDSGALRKLAEPVTLRDVSHDDGQEEEEESDPSPTKLSKKVLRRQARTDKRSKARALKKGKAVHTSDSESDSDADSSSSGANPGNDEDDLNARRQAIRHAEQLADQSLDDLDMWSSVWDEQRKAAEEEERTGSGSARRCLLWGGSAGGGTNAGGVGKEGDSRDILIRNVNLAYDNTALLEDATLKLSEGHRYGLVGRNGVGKTTLMRRMARGAIPGYPLHLKTLYVLQDVVGENISAIQSVLNVDRELIDLLDERKKLEARLGLAAAADMDADANVTTSNDSHAKDALDTVRLSEVETQLQIIDADTAPDRAADVLAGLGFTPAMQSSSTATLSGGWRMRVALAQALFAQPDILLLDEPSNHLDIQAVAWLENYINTQLTAASVLVVSHDRTFLDAICTDIVFMEGLSLSYYPGGFTAFAHTLKNKAMRMENKVDRITRQQEHHEQFLKKQRAAARDLKSKGGDQKKQKQIKQKTLKVDRLVMYREDGKRFQIHAKIGTLHPDYVDVGAVKQAKKRDLVQFQFKFPEPAASDLHPDVPIVVADQLAFSYAASSKVASTVEEPPQLLTDVSVGIYPKSRVAILGQNGSGKTTLLRLLAQELSPTAGEFTMGRSVTVGHVSQHHIDSLDLLATAIEVFSRHYSSWSELDIRSYLGKFGLHGDQALRPIHTLSGGQRTRLSFAIGLADRPSLLLMDEPTNYLDHDSLDALSTAVQEFEGAVVIVSHNQHFITSCASELWVTTPYVPPEAPEGEGGANDGVAIPPIHDGVANIDLSHDTHEVSPDGGPDGGSGAQRGGGRRRRKGRRRRGDGGGKKKKKKAPTGPPFTVKRLCDPYGDFVEAFAGYKQSLIAK